MAASTGLAQLFRVTKTTITTITRCLSSPIQTHLHQIPSLVAFTMRQLKHHEQKLLKKVDFLNVCPRITLTASQKLFPAMLL
jgi:hypothetical protein